MILILGGTTEGREISGMLRDRGHPFTVSVVTEYGFRIAEDSLGGRRRIHSGSLDYDGFIRLVEENRISAVIDATHPFAVAASKNSCEAAAQAGIPYLRYEREKCLFPESDLIKVADDFREAIRLIDEYQGVIFFAIGGNRLNGFVNRIRDRHRVVARVLPTLDSINNCVKAGIDVKNIVAAQGPFSKEFNQSCLKEYKASVLVTKNSGEVGGTREKVEAAVDLGIPVILIEPPPKQGPSFSDYDKLITEMERLRG